MEFKTAMAPLKEIVDAYSMVSMGDVFGALSKRLTRPELQAYSGASRKVMLREKLSRSDAILFNKIDEITMREFGMCLKDSKVTKARLKACKRFGIEFIDRDNLIDHMNLFLS
jgi:hypothetical protein